MNKRVLVQIVFAIFSVSVFATEKPFAVGEIHYSSPAELVGRNLGIDVQKAAAEVCGGVDQVLEVRDLEVKIYSPKGKSANGRLHLTYPRFQITGTAICR